ncbi:MAG: glycosyltransferase family 9 protein [Cyanobacteriota bacterium]
MIHLLQLSSQLLCFFLKLKDRLFFFLNEFLVARPSLVSILGFKYTIVDAFGTPGDTIQVAIVCRNLKNKFPQLKINCVTPNPELLIYDKNITQLNGPQGLPTLKFWYYHLILEKNGSTHLLSPTMTKVGLKKYDKKATFFLSEKEINWAKDYYHDNISKPFITINVQSREQVKTWLISRWSVLLGLIRVEFPDLAIVQLGADDEPYFDDVIRLAGSMSMRESVAIQSLAKIHIGCVSFLMHTANGVGVPSVIIYGGRETPSNSGYLENENLYTQLPCSPCWLHDSHGDVCPYDLICMHEISADQVLLGVKKIFQRHKYSVPLSSMN